MGFNGINVFYYGKKYTIRKKKGKTRRPIYLYNTNNNTNNNRTAAGTVNVILLYVHVFNNSKLHNSPTVGTRGVDRVCTRARAPRRRNNNRRRPAANSHGTLRAKDTAARDAGKTRPPSAIATVGVPLVGSPPPIQAEWKIRTENDALGLPPPPPRRQRGGQTLVVAAAVALPTYDLIRLRRRRRRRLTTTATVKNRTAGKRTVRRQRESARALAHKPTQYDGRSPYA